MLRRPDLVVSHGCEKCRVVFLQAHKQTTRAAVDVSVTASLVLEMVSGEAGVMLGEEYEESGPHLSLCRTGEKSCLALSHGTPLPVDRVWM